MLQLYRTQRINGSFWLIALLLLVQANGWLVQTFRLHEPFSLFGFKNSFLALAFGTVVLFIVASLLNNVCNRFQLFSASSNLPAALIILLFGLFSFRFSIDFWMLVSILMVLIINKLFKTYQKNKPEPNYFDVFFLFSIVTILFPEHIVLLPAFYICIFIFSIPNWRYLIIATLAFIMPWVFWFTYLVLTDNVGWFQEIGEKFTTQLTSFSTLSFSQLKPKLFVMLPFSVLAIIFWISTNHRLHHIQRPVLLFVTVFVVLCAVAATLFLPIQNGYLF